MSNSVLWRNLASEVIGTLKLTNMKIFIVLSVFAGGLEFVSIYLITGVVSAFQANEIAQIPNLFLKFPLLIFVIVAVTTLLRVLLVYMQNRLSAMVSSNKMRQVVHTLLVQKTGGENRSFRNDEKYSLLTEKSTVYGERFILPTLSAISAMLIIIPITLYLIQQAGQLLLIFLSIIFVVYLIILLANSKLRKRISSTLQIENEKIFSVAEFISNGSLQIRAEQNEYKIANSISTADVKFRFAKATQMFVAYYPKQIIELVLLFLVLFIAVTSSENGEVDDFILLGFSMLRILPLMQQIYGSFSMISSNLRDISMLCDIYDLNLPGTILKNHSKTEEVIKFESIELKNISCRIGEKLILGNANFQIKRGQKIALTGPSGSGKSTLISILLGQTEYEKGVITMNDKRVSEVHNEIVRNISFVPQKVFLPETTLREYIFDGQSGKAEERFLSLKEPLDLNFIDSLENGLDTQIIANGENFSGGQRQRIAMARAMLNDKPIIILDEATSALDQKREAKIVEYLLSHECLTVIFITHNKEVMRKFSIKNVIQ